MARYTVDGDTSSRCATALTRYIRDLSISTGPPQGMATSPSSDER
jgi:hypothetical protein